MLIAPLAIVIIRYGKYIKFFNGREKILYSMHALLCDLVIILTLVFTILLIEENDSPTFSSDEDLTEHNRLGIFILFGVLGVLFTGEYAIVQYLGFFKKVQAGLVALVHKILGWALLGFCVYECWIGQHLKDEGKYKIMFIVFLVLFGILFLVLEAVFNCRSYFSKATASKSYVSESSVQTLSVDEMDQQIQDKHPIVLLDNGAFNIDAYLKEAKHPGGNGLLQAALGKDMGRYLNGSATESAPGASTHLKNHPPAAYDDLMHYLVAKLDLKQYCLKQSGAPVEMPFQAETNISKLIAQHSQEWTVVGKRRISANLIHLVFHNPTLNLDSSMQSQWALDCGKHFKVLIPNTLVRKRVDQSSRFSSMYEFQHRFYSLARTLTPEHLKKAGIDLHYEWEYLDEAHKENVQQGTDYRYVDLWIKVYHNEGFVSKLMDKLALNDKVQIAGPIGVGLKITERFLSGSKQVVAFCGGTAVNIFVDLAYYVAQGSGNMTFHLFAAYPSMEDCYTFDLLQKLADQTQKFTFIPYFSVSDAKTENFRRRFDKDLIASAVEVKSIDRFYIRGPETFEFAIARALKELQVNEKAIYLL